MKLHLSAMLAEKYDPSKPLSGAWLVEPKLDGHRALWDGEELWARSGKPIYNPPEVLAYLREHFEGIALDGELCGASWGATQSAIKRRDPTYNTGVRYFVFDLLAVEGESLCGKTLFDRRVLLTDIIRTRTGDNPNAPVVLIPFEDDFSDPAEVARRFIAEGYEGAMLKRTASPYLCGIRSRDWLKVKFTQEVEVLITGATEGENRLTGSLGALEVRQPDGTEFRVGSGFSDADRQRLWQMHRAGQLVGLQVSVAYQNDKGFRGRFPVFLRLRDDLPRSGAVEHWDCLTCRTSFDPDTVPITYCKVCKEPTCPDCLTEEHNHDHEPDDGQPPTGPKDTGEGNPSGIPDSPEPRRASGRKRNDLRLLDLTGDPTTRLSVSRNPTRGVNDES